jgi:hypothetical protein
MLPVNTFITIQVARLPNETLPRDNNKLTARFFAVLPNTTTTNRTIDHPTDISATNFRPQTVPTIIKLTGKMLLLHAHIME